jgi:hypothetical protein
MAQIQGGQAVKTVPDKCPFCESPIMVHVGNLLVSEDGAFATYKCRTIQDIMWSDDQWKRTGQSDGCRKREVQLLTKRLDEASERIKRLEEVGDAMAAWLLDPRNLGGGSSMASQWYKAKEAKP